MVASKPERGVTVAAFIERLRDEVDAARLPAAVTLERLWAGWRTEYVSRHGESSPPDEGCVFCRILDSGEPDEAS